MRVDLLPLMVLAGALSVSGGAWVGYNMSVVARAALREVPKTVPMEAAPAASDVGTLTLRQVTVYGRSHLRAVSASVLPFALPTPDPAPTFFDFHHSYCDEAEGTHGKVLRCSKTPR